MAIDSPSRGERKLCDALIAQLTALGIEPQEDDSARHTNGSAGNLYAYVGGSIMLPPILLSAHMDTVEPSGGKKAVLSLDGRITSDGTTVLGADDLSGVAAILEAVTALKESGKPHRPFELLFDVAEEAYCAGIRQFDFSKLRAKEAYVFDLPGPVGGAAYQAPSILAFRAEFFGRAAHAAFSPEKGIHAIQTAAAAITRLPCGLVGNTTVNIGTIAGGSADNIVPDYCVLTGEVRSFSAADAHARLAQMENTIKKAAEECHTAIRFESNALCAAYQIDPNHPVARRFKNVCGELGLIPDLLQTYGGSDNNHFAAHGISGLVVASGMNLCHSCEEYTSIDELERSARLALALILAKE